MLEVVAGVEEVPAAVRVTLFSFTERDFCFIQYFWFMTGFGSVGGGLRERDADAVDAAVGGGKDFEAEAVFFDDFAAHGNVAGNLRDKPAEGGRLVVLGETEGGGLVGIAVSVAEGVLAGEEVFAGVGIFEVGVRLRLGRRGRGDGF